MATLEDPAPPTRVGEAVAFSRRTRDGRYLHYELRVLQQPERARACGSGPKSSADRRPVDPPPVVQMKVFQSPTADRANAEDITFGYNADFFLYASLQHYIDPKARGQQPQPGPPVLTGMPVSSMILLDRPEEAGYFIFSDLSVRHEGTYFLTFALMEEVKDDRDKDVDEPMSGTDEITSPEDGDGRHYLFRTQVKTDFFNVFSAKKFPGLMESTALSRTVAEQGCRVRIRRDVRMRRREKGGKKDIASRDDDEYARRAKNDAAANASRDGSSGNDANGYYGRPAEIQRRPSGMGNGPPVIPNGYQHRPPGPPPEPASGGRQPPYGHMPPYAPSGRSIPSSPAYPSPPHLAPYPPRPSYGPYAPERTPPHHGPPPPSHPRDAQEGYHYRPDPPRLQPVLAPKIPAPIAKKPLMGPEREQLPPLHSAIGGGVPPETRRPSHNMPPLPRLLPHPVGSRKDDQHIHLPPISLAPNTYTPHQRRMPSLPPTPNTPSIMRKRSADEANLGSVDDDYRLQNGRRREEQPLDANYRPGPRRQEADPRYMSNKGPVTATAPTPMYRDIYHAAPSAPGGGDIPVQPIRTIAPEDWRMTLDQYNRASDNDILVDFPGLQAT